MKIKVLKYTLQVLVFGEAGHKDMNGQAVDGVHFRGAHGIGIFTKSYAKLVKDFMFNT